jgi:predicted GNAT family acetyltransferase
MAGPAAGRPRQSQPEERIDMSCGVIDNPASSRFELAHETAVAFIEYRREGDGRIVLTHTEVPETLSGRGIGSRLVRGTLDLLRGVGLSVVPRCEFVAAFIERHPEYQDLLADHG